MIQGDTDEHNLEYQVQNRKGEYVWVLCRGRLQRDENESPRMFVGVVVDLKNKGKFDYTTGLLTLHAYINRPHRLDDREYFCTVSGASQCWIKTARVIRSCCCGSARPLAGFPPMEFIAILELTNLIVPVGKWVLGQAVCMCKRWTVHQADFVMNVTVIQLCHSVGITVCFEGVERQEELMTVCDLKTDNIQGYYLSRPIFPEEFEKKYWP